jgi:hypothetical protein
MTGRSVKWRGILRRAPRGAFAKSLLLSIFSMANFYVGTGKSACATASAVAREPIPLAITQTRHKPGGPQGNTASRQLHKVGETVAKAVLDKDIPTLLNYDRADLRPSDEVSLKNPKSDLYCYIFDSNCITWGDGTWRSVYDKLSQAHQLEIKVSVSSSRYDRQLYGNLFFYDAAAVSEKDLRSRDYVCKAGPANIASWKFRLEKGKWKPVTPLFDSETRDCPSDVEGNG